ncbi:hypothetical protein WH50_05785 [Pokkaliibacter plantistimulans]|uniref:Pyridoxal phosphate homeostasis protein n=1 Tax=Pokkaliibacter plantistimulans TaxID=1635171 RepID=A0ABX5M5Q5_9GAMM|nr:YggS family pyridoxal phosphate-dependent enzyme [Pokkaliibacter plantistimulans]PXF32235.1 hypothetical protein WH50_05785 [Pokkaliibacter plantistimulans]
MSIAENLQDVYRRIRAAESAAGRQPGSVQLLAVSKTKPAEAVREAWQAGQRAFGENYVQEGVDKVQALADLAIDWHFIGPLQSNKTRIVAEHFHWVHSVDRLKIAQRLSEQRPADLPPLNLCLQINISGEDSKSGISLSELPALAHTVATLPNIQLRGLMCIPAPCTDPAQQRLPFQQLATALNALQHDLPQLDTLSMGMTDDMDAAIAEGATWVRIGTAIFGARNYA